MGSDTPSLIEATVTTKFMQDYEGGGGLQRPAFPSSIQGFLDRDGSPHIVIVTDATTFKHARRDAQSETGWALVEAPLPDDVAGHRSGVGTTPLIVGGERLVIFRELSIQVADIAPDGTIGPVRMAVTKASSQPVPPDLDGAGSFPSGTRYVMEALTDASNNISGYVLRDLTDFTPHPVEAGALKVTGKVDGAYMGPLVIPLRDNGPDRFRCVVLDGTIRSLTLLRDPTSGTFKATQNVQLGQPQAATDLFDSSQYRVHVDEETPGQVSVLIVDLPGVRVIRGTYDPAAAGEIAWGTPWQSALPNFEIPDDWKNVRNMAWLAGGWNSDAKAVELFLSILPLDSREKYHEVWTCAWTPGGDITELAPLDAAVVMKLLAAERPVLLLSADRGVEVWERNEDGDFDVDPIVIEAEAESFAELQCYRVGISLVQNDLPLAGQELGLTASLSVRARVNAAAAMIRTTTPYKAVTDGNGEIWITLPLENRLSFPRLFLSSPLFPDPLELHIDSEIQEHLRNVSNDALTAAVDPRTNTPVLKHQQNAADIGEALRAAMSLAPKPAQGVQSKAVEVKSSCPWRWRVNEPVHALAVLPPLALANAPSWILDVTSGKPSFRTLHAAEAQSLIAEMNAKHPSIPAARRPGGVRPMGWGFLGDFVDWVSDVASAVWDGLCTVTTMVVDGAKLTMHLVLDGATFVFNGVLDTLERVMDAVTYVLDIAGEALGAAVGWLLEQLGFLFDWSAIKKRRDQMRDAVRNGFGPAIQRLPDPAGAAASIGATLDGAKDAVIAALNGFRSSPAGSRSLSQTTALFPGFSQIMALGDVSVMPQATWLMDKMKEVLNRLIPDIGMPSVPGFDFPAALAEFGAAAQAAMTRIGPSLDDLSTLVQSWFLDGTLFSNEVLDPFIDLLVKHVSALFDAIKEIAASMAKILHAFWSNPTAIIDWMDSKIRVPFFGGFYKGLTGRDLSAFDVACLGAAIVGVATGATPAAHRLASPARALAVSDTVADAVAFAYLGVLTDAFNSFWSAAFPQNTMLTTVLDKATTIGIIACTLPPGSIGDSGKPLIEDCVVVGAVGVGAAILGAFPSARSYAGDVGLVGMQLYRSISMLRGGEHASTYAALGLVKTTLNAVMRGMVLSKNGGDYSSPRGLPAVPAFVYAASQTGLTVARGYLFKQALTESAT